LPGRCCIFFKSASEYAKICHILDKKTAYPYSPPQVTFLHIEFLAFPGRNTFRSRAVTVGSRPAPSRLLAFYAVTQCPQHHSQVNVHGKRTGANINCCFSVVWCDAVDHIHSVAAAVPGFSSVNFRTSPAMLLHAALQRRKWPPYRTTEDNLKARHSSVMLQKSAIGRVSK